MKTWILVAVIATITCGSNADQKAATILQESLMNASPQIRILAAKGLAQTGDMVGLEVLAGMVQEDDVEACAAALSALCVLPDITYESIYAQHTEHEHMIVRTAAYRLIACIDDKQCWKILVRGTQDDVAKIRRICYQGLEKFRDRETVMHGLRDIDPLTRITAAQVLGTLGEEGMIDYVKNEAATESTDITQRSLIALATMGDESALSMIRESVCSKTWDVRLTAVEALFIMNKPDEMNVLEQAFDSEDPFVRARAADILKEFPRPQSVHLLEKAARDEYVNVSVAAIEALSQYHLQKHTRLFSELMDSGSVTVRIAAATAYMQVQ
jgi:HEAT repeat protein